MKQYNKLVRDRIPEIIRAQGETPCIRILTPEEFRQHLEIKLDEEVAEFHEDCNLEELADILEVVYGLCEANGYTQEELFAVCEKKHRERGGFSERIFLVSKE